MSNYEELTKEIRKKQDELKKEMFVLGQSFLKEQFKNIFEEYPDLDRISWTQYTPYFNDGDECVFSAYVDYPMVMTKENVLAVENDEADLYDFEAFDYSHRKDHIMTPEQERNTKIISILRAVDQDV